MAAPMVMMELYSQPDNATGPYFQKEAVVWAKGRRLNELKSVEVLLKYGILFSLKKGKARKRTPLPYLHRGEWVPIDLKYVVIPKGCRPGNKLWGRIDYLVNYCNYQLIDERK